MKDPPPHPVGSPGLWRPDRGADPLGCARGAVSATRARSLPSTCRATPGRPRCPIRTHPLGCRAGPPVEGRVPFLRYGFAPRLVPWLRAHVARFDAVVVHGLWNYADLAARRVLPRSGVPYFVFTHGMLDPWFKRAYPLKHVPSDWSGHCRKARSSARLAPSSSPARTKDRLPTPLSDPIGSRRRSQATGSPILRPLRAASRRRSNAASLRCAAPTCCSSAGCIEKKGCDLLIQAFASLAGRHPDLDLVIAGPDPGGLRPGLAALAADLGIGHRLHWPGMLTGDAKVGRAARLRRPLPCPLTARTLGWRWRKPWRAAGPC